jgi:hypothetical protein
MKILTTSIIEHHIKLCFFVNNKSFLAKIERWNIDTMFAMMDKMGIEYEIKDEKHLIRRAGYLIVQRDKGQIVPKFDVGDIMCYDLDDMCFKMIDSNSGDKLFEFYTNYGFVNSFFAALKEYGIEFVENSMMNYVPKKIDHIVESAIQWSV